MAMVTSQDADDISMETEDYSHGNGDSPSCDEADTTTTQQSQGSSPVSNRVELLHNGLKPQQIHVDAPISDDSSEMIIPVSDNDTESSSTEAHDKRVSTIPDQVFQDNVRIPSPPLSLKESLGLVGALSIIAGYVGILALLGFLSFLWYGYGPSAEAADATYVWRQIAIGDWMTQVITLCALALRITISLQSTVCTSMIAALVLEKRFVRRYNVAYLSVLRSINDGPRKLVEVMLHSGVAILKYLEFWLALFMVLTTLALQFTSTILLSDLNDFAIAGNVNRTQVPSLMVYGPEDWDFRLSSGGFFSRMPVYQMFAEAPSESNALPDPKGLSSTGLIQRGFLPLADSESRVSLRRFDGNIMTMNSKVACMRPILDAHYITYDSDSGATYRFVRGLLKTDSSLQDAGASGTASCDTSECEDLYFECSIPFSLNRVGSWESMPCLVGGVGGSFWGIDLFPKWDSSFEPWSPNSTIQLIFTSNMRRTDWDTLPREGSMGTSNPYYEWQSFEPIPGRHINVTVCFSAFNLARKSVLITAQNVLREPSTNWSLTSVRYDTSDVQKFMGVSVPHQPFGERGLLSMDIIGEPDDGPPDSPAHKVVTLNGKHRVENHTIADLTTRVLEEIIDYELTISKAANSTVLSCYACEGEAITEHPVLAMLFTSIIAETGRAANAIQSFMTVVSLSWFDAYQSSLGELQWADVVMTKMVRTPGPCSEYGCGGYISVVTLLIIHLVYVAVITFLYVRQVRYSRYDNIWHTISQLVSTELREPLEKANNVGDKVVKSFCKELDDDRVQLGTVLETGRIEVVKLPDNQKIPEPGASRFAKSKRTLGEKKRTGEDSAV
ncbi:hypothetical protein F4818DRAFT_454428 [Hypoxylon cercidicola]|nr:hypothetical protein F4818DRAFT_454428 [Hypoxylon cercidicola]